MARAKNLPQGKGKFKAVGRDTRYGKHASALRIMASDSRWRERDGKTYPVTVTRIATA